MGTEALTDHAARGDEGPWAVGEGTVADVVSAMAEDGRELAPTTVATLLQRLSQQGWVERQRSGRQFVYRASVDQKEAAKACSTACCRSFFGGRASALTAQLLESEQLSPEELEEMQRLIKEKGA